MENKNGKCSRCKYFNRYYTKGTKQFNKTKFGWCQKSGVKEASASCPEFSIKQKGDNGLLFLKICLNDLLTEISEIRKILEVENEIENL